MENKYEKVGEIENGQVFLDHTGRAFVKTNQTREDKTVVICLANGWDHEFNPDEEVKKITV